MNNIKKTIVAVTLTPLLVIAGDYVTVVSGLHDTYKNGNFTKTISYTNWIDSGNEYSCTSDINEADVYYNKTANQTNDCKQDQTREKIVTTTYEDGRVTEDRTVENQTIDTQNIVSITGTHLELSCKDILDNNYSEGNGDYYINYNANPFNVYCDMTHDGGGWTMVRRITGAWNSFSDSLFGTQNVGTYVSNPNDGNTFGIVFNNITYNELYLTTGDKQKWLITDKSSVQDNWISGSSCSSPGVIYKSSSNPTGPTQTVGWCKRTPNSEDPWISIESHGHNGRSSLNDDLTHSMLYGENYAGWNYYVGNLDGVTIYIR